MAARLTWYAYRFGSFADTRLGRITIRPIGATRGPLTWDVRYPDGQFARRNSKEEAQRTAQAWFDHEVAHLP